MEHKTRLKSASMVWELCRKKSTVMSRWKARLTVTLKMTVHCRSTGAPGMLQLGRILSMASAIYVAQCLRARSRVADRLMPEVARRLARTMGQLPQSQSKQEEL